MRPERTLRYWDYRRMSVKLEDYYLKVIHELVKKDAAVLEKLNNASILVTGANGLIGSQTIKLLSVINSAYQTNMKIIALVRNEEKAKLLLKDYSDCNFINILIGDITNPIDYKNTLDFIIHGASMTASKDFVDKPVETIQTAIIGTNNLLELAKSKKVKSFIYLSSLEVYGQNETFNVTEKDFGYIDPLNVRSSYSEGKRMVECLCYSYYKEYDVPIKLVRLTQTFGAGVHYDDNRVFAQFARSIVERRDIILYTKGETVRSYVDTADAAAAILTVMTIGNNGEAYNIANKDNLISIFDMAKMLINEYPESKSNVILELDHNADKMGFNPVIKISLDTGKINGLGWFPQHNLNTMFDIMINGMVDEKNDRRDSLEIE